jgi:fatty-acyl-CoA synthase
MALRFADHTAEEYQYKLTIGHLLEGALSTSADQRIHYRDRESYTYAEFKSRVGKLASLLVNLGADAGDTIAVMDWDSHRYLEAYFAIPMMGAVLQTVNVRLPAPQITYTLQKAEARILIVHSDFYPIIDAIRPLLSGIKAVIAISDGHKAPLPHWAVGEYEALSAAASPDYPFEDLDENAIATTFFTTGTTGNPKGVSFSHRQLVLHTLAATGPFGASSRYPSLGYEDVYMPLTPMFHVHAWGMPYVATLLGVKQVYPGRYDPELICRLREEHSVSFSHCVPTIVQMVMQMAEKTGANLAGWTLIIAGSALSKPLLADGWRMGLKLYAAYGMSESAPLICLTRPTLGKDGEPGDNASTLTAAGIPAPLVKVRIVDEDMNDVPHDGITPGELVVRSPWLTSGYHEEEDASKALWQGGWLHTQDIATIDGSGYVRIRDRLKDIIKTGGEWIDSIHLEELVLSCDDIAEVAVIAVPDAKWGERPLAVIVPVADANVTLETINAPVEESIQQGLITKYARIERVELVETLPRTSVGKIDKKQLRRTFGQTKVD